MNSRGNQCSEHEEQILRSVPYRISKELMGNEVGRQVGHEISHYINDQISDTELRIGLTNILGPQGQ